jgi:hypothetical protein
MLVALKALQLPPGGSVAMRTENRDLIPVNYSTNNMSLSMTQEKVSRHCQHSSELVYFKPNRDAMRVPVTLL